MEAVEWAVFTAWARRGCTSFSANVPVSGVRRTMPLGGSRKEAQTEKMISPQSTNISKTTWNHEITSRQTDILQSNFWRGTDAKGSSHRKDGEGVLSCKVRVHWAVGYIGQEILHHGPESNGQWVSVENLSYGPGKGSCLGTSIPSYKTGLKL